MMTTAPLFACALDHINPDTVLRTEATPHLKRRERPLPLDAMGASHTPSNQEILAAAKAQYHQHSGLVDRNTLAGQHYVKTSPGHLNVAALNGYNWKSQQAVPITPTAEMVAASPIIQPGFEEAYGSGDVASCVIGISESAQFIVGEEGGVGIAFDSAGQGKGSVYVAGKLGLDIDAAINLQMGLWAADVAGLAGDFVGLEVNLDLDVGVCLGIYLKPKDLTFYGYSIGVGVGVGGGVTIVGGYTWIF